MVCTYVHTAARVSCACRFEFLPCCCSAKNYAAFSPEISHFLQVSSGKVKEGTVILRNVSGRNDVMVVDNINSPTPEK